ncbi:MAG: MFS transporter [Jatrophihabitans sp.]
MAVTLAAAPHESRARSGAEPWSMLLVLLLGQFMALLDLYIVNIALPRIGTDLHASGAGLQLVIGGYTVSYAMSLITGARLGAIFGRRRMYLLGTVGFTVTSLACGLAPNIVTLIALRAVQGASAAALVPQIMSMIQMQFRGPARAKALSAYALVLCVGSIVGLVLGGVLVSANVLHTGWRPVFLVNVPIGVALIALVPRVVPADRPTGARRLDLAGLVLAVTAVILVVLPLVLGHELGWPAWAFLCISGGLILLTLFVRLERRIGARGGDPLLDLTVLFSPGLRSGLVTLFLVMAGYGCFLFCFGLHLQSGLGDDPLRAAVTFLPFGVAFGLVAFFWRSLPARLHSMLPALGLTLAAAASVVIALAMRDGGHGGALMWIGTVATGAGVGLTTSLLALSLRHVPAERAADASGVVTTTMQLGQVIGVAALGTIYLSRTATGAVRSGAALANTSLWVAVVFVTGLASAAALVRAMNRAR